MKYALVALELLSKSKRHTLSRCLKQKGKKMTNNDALRCSRCGAMGGTMWVHGHEQCAVCHQIADGDCCSGETSSCLTPEEKPSDYQDR